MGYTAKGIFDVDLTWKADYTYLLQLVTAKQELEILFYRTYFTIGEMTKHFG